MWGWTNRNTENISFHYASLSVSDMPAAPRTIFRDHFLDMAATTIGSLVKDDSAEWARGTRNLPRY